MMRKDNTIFSATPHLSTGQMLHYLRGSMTRDAKHALEQHLSDCEMCSDALDGLRGLEAGTKPEVIISDLRSMARKRKIMRRKIFTPLELMSVFAVLFLILFLVIIAVIVFIRK